MPERITEKPGDYKPFIDGLRAVSILAVVLYHAGWKFLPGGFVGVDVFFVISGYLIISHLVGSLRKGTFSFGEFWARRALRILPPYLLVVCASCVAASFFLVLPGEFKAFGEQVAYSSVMLANHYFLDQQGYFDGSADTKPLLHLWSLGVEEQFYLAAPALIFLLYRLNKALPKKTGKALVAVVSALVFSASLYLSIQLSVASSDAKNFAFYLMPLRAWEFLVGGSLVALVPMAKKMSRLMLEASGWLGILLILWAVSAVSGDEPYPKFNALYPVFGAALVMLAGLANPRVTAARCLAVTPMVWIGLVSYAWYLWHWPLMTFGRIYHFGEKNLFFDSAMAVVSLGLAWATYVLIDKRILLWRKSLTGKLGWSHVGKVAWGCAPVLLVGVTISQYYAPRVEASFTEAQAPRPASRDPECDLQRIAGVEICQEFAGNRTMGVLIGDSHGAAAYRQLARHADQRDIVIATMVGGACAPIFGLRVNIVDPGMRERCWDGRDRALPMLGTSLTPEFALLVGRWDIYTRQTGQYSLSEPGSKRPLENLHDGFVRNLRDTVIELKRRGVQRVLVIGPVPELELPAPACVIRAEKYGVDRDQRCSVPRVDVEARRDQVVAWLNESLSGLNSVRFIDPLPAFCDTEWCKPYGSQGVLYFDTNHLSDAGLEQIIQSSRNDFEWLFGSPG